MFRRVLLTILSFLSLAPFTRAQVQLQPAFPSLSFVEAIGLERSVDGSNRLFVLERMGKIWVFDNHPNVTQRTLFLDIENRVADVSFEMGLLGLAFHPNFADSGYFYVNYTFCCPLESRISRFTVTANPDSADATSEKILMTLAQPFTNHNGGQIVFGVGGYLYIGFGDGGGGGDPLGNAQNRTTLLGSLLRIDVDTKQGALEYGIPPDNPFVGNAQGWREEIYAWGLRNPWRFSFDPPTGRLWLGDVGQEAWEEIDLIEKGKNYGWPIMEGNHCFPSPPCDSTGLEPPVWEYPHPVGTTSVTGGYVYRGTLIQNLIGHYVYADFGSGEIWSLSYDGVNPVVNTLLLDSPHSISTFGIDEHNELYLVDFDFVSGQIYRFVPIVTGLPGTRPPPPRSLVRNYPNPFNPQTTIEFIVETPAFVELDIFDVNGGAVRRLVGRFFGEGTHKVSWGGRNDAGHPVSSGIYFYRYRLDGRDAETKRMVLLK